MPLMGRGAALFDYLYPIQLFSSELGLLDANKVAFLTHFHSGFPGRSPQSRSPFLPSIVTVVDLSLTCR